MYRIENTLSIPDRLLQTWLTVPSNIFDTLSAIPKDIKGVVKNTTEKIKNIFKSAVKKWKRYQRVWNTLLSPFVSLWAAVEWAVRTVVTPTTNFLVNTAKTLKNTVYNTRKSTFWSAFSDKPTSSFEYEELKTADVIKKNKNWISKWRFGRKVFKDNQWDNNNNTKTSTETKSNTVKNDTVSWWTKQWKKSEVVETIVQHRWVEEAKRILSDSACGKKIIDGLCERNEDFWIIFDNTTAIGRCNENNTITIWTEMPGGIAALAPFNWKAKNSEVQKKHLLLHELWHCVVHSRSQEIPGINKWLDLIKKYIETRKNIDWKTLSLLSYRNDSTYPTSREKAREDFVEMLALRMNWNWDLCKKYLKLLSSDKYIKFRDNNWLATISKEDASKLQNIFDSIIHYYENSNN